MLIGCMLWSFGESFNDILVLQGKALLNELRLSDYPALDGQTLHMMFKPAATGTESSAEASPAAPDQLMASLAARGADVSFWKDLYGWLETTGFNGDSAAAARVRSLLPAFFFIHPSRS